MFVKSETRHKGTLGHGLVSEYVEGEIVASDTTSIKPEFESEMTVQPATWVAGYLTVAASLRSLVR